MYTMSDEELANLLRSEGDSASPEATATLIEAVKRIEQANLWKTLMTTSVFDVGSARPEILASVNAEIREFARLKLEECVGMRSPQPASNQSASVFDQDEIQALKILAAKLLKKETVSMPEYQPTLKSIAATAAATTSVPTPSIKKAAAPSASVNSVNVSKPEKSLTNSKKTSRSKKEDLGPHYIPQPTDGYVAPQLTEGGHSLINQSSEIAGGGTLPLDMLVAKSLKG